MSQSVGERRPRPSGDSNNGDSRRVAAPAPTRAAFIAALPKVDLHAHINGSLPAATVLELLKDADPALYKAASGDGEGSVVLRSAALLAMPDPKTRMARCFKVFDAVYRVMATAERMRRAVFAMLDAYRAENTAYLELRTTPRAGVSFPVAGDGDDTARREGTAAEYVDYTLQLLDEYDAAAIAAAAKADAAPRMEVRLLLSVGRRMTAAVAEQTVDLAIAARNARTVPTADGSKGPPRMVGVDFSGDCYSGVWATYAPAIAKAKAAGLRVTLHVGEKDDDAELAAMLDARPDRIGHLVFANAANAARVRRERVPLELCITSNLMTTDWAVGDHHVGDWFALDDRAAASTSADDGLKASVLDRVPALRHPVSINTDDRGVFDCTLSHELGLFLDAVFGGDKVLERDAPIRPAEALALVAVTKQAIHDAFAPDARLELLRRLGDFCESVRPLLESALACS